MISQAISLHEWETVRPEPGSPLAARGLSDEHASRLAERLAKRGCIEILELARGLELRASSYVGRFRLGDLTVTVQPKLSGAPFLHMLRYAYGLRHLDLHDPAQYDTQKWSFQELLIQQLSTEAAQLLSRGIHREYERTHAELANPRGRIEFGRLVDSMYRPRATLPCMHHPRSEDTVLNQALLAGLIHAAQFCSDADLRTRVTRQAKVLGSMVSQNRLNSKLLAEAKLSIDRRTRAYEPALILTGLLMQSEGVSLDGEHSKIRLPGFLFDMNRFFQALLSRFLHDYLHGYDVEDECRLKELFHYDPRHNPKGRRAPVQKPDFIIRSKGRLVAVLDAKYRDLWETTLPREMLYQLALYALGRKGSDRRAVILYPTLSSAARSQAVIINDPNSGATQAQVVLRPVHMLKMDELLRNNSRGSGALKAAWAHHLAFGADDKAS